MDRSQMYRKLGRFSDRLAVGDFNPPRWWYRSMTAVATFFWGKSEGKNN